MTQARKKLVVIVAALTVLSGCGSSSDGHDVHHRSAEGGLAQMLEEAPPLSLSAAAGPLMTEMDDAGLADPRPLFHDGRISDVLVGTVVDFVPGPSLAAWESDPFPESTTILRVKTVKVLKGGLRRGETAYVQLFGKRDPATALKSIPRGSVVVVYGVSVSDDEPFVRNPSQGKPVDATFLRPGHVGLAVLAPGGGLVYPTRGDSHREWGIERLIPERYLDPKTELGRALKE